MTDWQMAAFNVATFEVDVTPPLGHALMGGGIAPAKEIVDPLRAQGIVLLSSEPPIVWFSIDWCETRNDAYDTWRDALAAAAKTSRERILLAAIHQHDTPLVDFAAQKMLDGVGLRNSLCDVSFVKDCIHRSAAALRESLSHSRRVTHYGVGTDTVNGVASNRRILNAAGVPVYHRNSSAPEQAIRNAPIGLIDPHVRTLSFWSNDELLAGISTYAVHPMSYYGKGGVSADFVGMARARMQQETPAAPQLYFSGCSGDLVAGKHNDGSPGERPKLAERLYTGLRGAWYNTKKFPLERAKFRCVPLVLPLRETTDFTEAEQRRVLSDTTAKPFDRNLAAMGLSWRKRHAAGQAIDLCVVDFGAAQFLLMPAESFVAYQLRAQALRRDSTVLVAGYGECAPGYIPSEDAVREGFIDAHNWCWVGPDAPAAMEDALRRALT